MLIRRHPHALPIVPDARAVAAARLICKVGLRQALNTPPPRHAVPVPAPVRGNWPGLFR